MFSIALDPFTPERPLKVAQSFVSLIHGVLEERQTPGMDQARARLRAMEIIAGQVMGEVRFDAERLMYLAARAAYDGFPVHHQLIEIALQHETEIKRLGSEVISEYKSLSRKLQMPQRTSSLLKEIFEAAEGFQEEWLTVVRQMRHRASAISRQKVPEVNVGIAAELYSAAAAELIGDVSGLAMRPFIAADMVVYEMILPPPPGGLAGPEAAAALADAVHARVEANAPLLAGCFSIRFDTHANPS